MKAIVRTEYGPADVLRLTDLPRPEPGDDEVLVRIAAAGVGPEVWHVMTGRPEMVRLMGFGFRRPKQPALGQDFAGTVETVGRNVTDVGPGDEVFGAGTGALAEYARAPAKTIAPKPANLTFEQAAAVPVSGCTALQALRDRGGLQKGQSVLVIGASGGVGTFAVQLAKAFGAEVTGLCGPANGELVRSLGADVVLDYTKDDVTDGTHRFDLVLDAGGRRTLRALRRALTPRGTLVIVGGEGGGRWTGGFGRQIVRAPLISLVVGQKLRPVTGTVKGADLRTLTEFIEDGRLAPVIGRTAPLAETAELLDEAGEGHRRGKSVVTVD